jgi:hypothetical protein
MIDAPSAAVFPRWTRFHPKSSSPAGVQNSVVDVLNQPEATAHHAFLFGDIVGHIQRENLRASGLEHIERPKHHFMLAAQRTLKMVPDRGFQGVLSIYRYSKDE